LFYLLYIFTIVFLALIVFEAFKLSIIIFDGIWHTKLRGIINKNPDIGLQDKDGNFTYKQGVFTVRYRVVSSNTDGSFKKAKIDYIKKDRYGYGRGFIRFEKKVDDFWRYRKWRNFLRPGMILFLLLIILFPYYLLFEPQADKEYRLEWLISKVLRVRTEDVVIRPDGWIKILATRITAVDRQREPISFNVNLVKWLTFQDDGYIARNRGVVENYDYGDVVYPVHYGISSLFLEKDNGWVSGKLNGIEEVTWEEAQGTGIRAGAVHGEKRNLEERVFTIQDE
jgi:hypothetical protein